MKKKGLVIFWAILIILVVLIRIYSAHSQRVENDYSNGIYPYFSTALRAVFGWLPFSIGDIIYGVLFIFIMWKLIKGIRDLFKKRVSWKSFGKGVLDTIAVFLVIYILFNLFWGINYNRKGIANQLELKMGKYGLTDLKEINAMLVQKVNDSKLSLMNRGEKYPTTKQLFAQVQEAYSKIDSTYPFLQYHNRSIKPSIWGWLGNYMGYTGYYNPLTGEAQVVTSVPEFLQPFICCHEVGHQLGYAKEMEANFVGYLAASSSKDTLLQYSVYLEMFLSSNRNLYGSDSTAAKIFSKQLIPAVKADITEWRNFYKRYKNPVEPVFRWLYGKYLENNEQKQGILSYDEVTSFLIAYYKKYGRI